MNKDTIINFMRFKFLFISYFFIFYFDFAEAIIERRGAFDVGSGSIKLLVADVDTETHHIENYLFSDVIKVPFSAHLARSLDGSFNKLVFDQAKEAILKLLKRAEPYRPIRFFGVATEAFRLAENGLECASILTNETSVPIKIISQKEEGELGFESAVEHSKGDPENAVVWDIGRGSFQISWKHSNQVHSYIGSFGKVPMKNLIISFIQGKSLYDTTSPNPISQYDANVAKFFLIKQLRLIPQSLQEKLQHIDTQVYGIGAIHHRNISRSIGQPVYTLPIVEELLLNRLGLADESFDEGIDAQYWVSDLIFVSCIMSHLKIQSVLDVKSYENTNVEVAGNTVGILIRSEYWND